MILRMFGSESTIASANGGGTQSLEEKSCEVENVIDLIHGMQNVEIEPNKDGEIGLIGKNSINQPCITGEGRFPNSWAQVINSEGTIGVDSKPQQSNDSWGLWGPPCLAPSPTSSPSLQNAWQWSEKADKSYIQTNIQTKKSNSHHHESIVVYDPEIEKLSQDDEVSINFGDELLDDSESDVSDGFDSDGNQRSHDIRKKNKWLRPFFESLDNLGVEEINEQSRQWHCPACQDGPGAINWFIGLQSLMAHAKTKGRIRIRLHRELAELLEEELRRRGISFIQPGEAFGKWKGLSQTKTDHEIVWPPMVVVMNTRLEKDENEKWKGMGNQELLDYFNTYKAVKARHSYGPNGHRGMSVLIFEASAMGYLEAERLHKHFLGEGRDRCSWERHPVLFYPGGERQLYGFLASKDDLLIFNKHSHGKGCLKFEIRSYQEMVVGPIKKMSNDNQELIWLKNKVMQHGQRSKAFEETFGVVSQKLRDTIEENRIVRHRMKIHHEENKEEMDYQERFFKDQLDKLRNVTQEKEMAFEKLLQEEQMNSKQSDAGSGTIKNCSLWNEEMQSFEAGKLKIASEFEEWEKMIRLHEVNKIELKRKHLAEEIELEKNFEVHLTEFLEKYSHPSFQISSSS